MDAATEEWPRALVWGEGMNLRVSEHRRNIFGGYDEVMGVSLLGWYRGGRMILGNPHVRHSLNSWQWVI